MNEYLHENVADLWRKEGRESLSPSNLDTSWFKYQLHCLRAFLSKTGHFVQLVLLWALLGAWF